MAQATYDDANLLLRLYDLRREAKLRAAREWFGSSFRACPFEELEKNYPPGSEQNAYVRMVVGYWEMAASLITAGVLNEDLFFENNREMLLVWEKIKPLVHEVRERTKDPMAWSNLEKVAESFVKWLNKRSPEAYETWRGWVRASAPAAPKQGG